MHGVQLGFNLNKLMPRLYIQVWQPVTERKASKKVLSYWKESF